MVRTKNPIKKSKYIINKIITWHIELTIGGKVGANKAHKYLRTKFDRVLSLRRRC